MNGHLILCDFVVCLDKTDQILKDTYLILENDLIVEIGLKKDLDDRRKFDKESNLSNRLVMPGLINAHTHTPMTLFRGAAEGHTLFNMKGWYNTIRVLELEMTPEMLPPGVAVSCAEMIRTGTTCFVDQYFWMDQIYPVVQQSGLRAALAYGIVELGEESARKREIAAAAKFLESLKDDPLLDGWIGPHAFFVDNSEAAMKLEKDLAEKYDTGFHIHFATSDSENKYCREKYGRTAIQQLNEMGILDHRILAAHSIRIPHEDFALASEKSFTPVFAPSSAMKNAAGVAPLIEMMKADVNVALGTDNVTNNNNYDMFKEMALTGKLMALTHHDAAAIPTRFILDMATINGAKAIGKEKEIGSLEIGKKADLISLDLNEIGWAPTGGQDIYTALVYAISGYHTRDVMVNGQWLYRDGEYKTLDYRKSVRELNEKQAELANKVAQQKGKNE